MEIHLNWLLALAWFGGTLPILIASLPSSSLNSLHQLLLDFAKRGKIMHKSSLKFTVPQRFFLHFYLLGVVWTTFLLIITSQYAYKIGLLDYDSAAAWLAGYSDLPNSEIIYRVWVSVFVLLLMDLHVLRRLYETVYVFKYSPSARMHILGYLTGLFFYTAAPLSFCHFCILDSLSAAEYLAIKMNGKSEGISRIDFNWQGYLEPIVMLGWCQWAGAAIFAWGWVHQHQCHAILGSLRDQGAQVDEYLIPCGDWFEMVSSPHYLAEMVIYIGLLVASGGNDFVIWLLNLFVVANLVFAAAETQRWYQRKFEDYPRKRCAILPFVY